MNTSRCTPRRSLDDARAAGLSDKVDTMLRVSRSLDAHGVLHIFTGSFVGWLHGASRLPRDVDVIAHPHAANVAAYVAAPGRVPPVAIGDIVRELVGPGVDAQGLTDTNTGRFWRVEGVPVLAPEMLVLRKLLRARACLDPEVLRAAEREHGAQPPFMRVASPDEDVRDAVEVMRANVDVMSVAGLPAMEGLPLAARVLCELGPDHPAGRAALAAVPLGHTLALLDVIPRSAGAWWGRTYTPAPSVVTRGAPVSRASRRREA